MTTNDNTSPGNPCTDADRMADEHIARLQITDERQQKFVRVHEHMHVLFNKECTAEHRAASMDRIQQIVEGDPDASQRLEALKSLLGWWE